MRRHEPGVVWVLREDRSEYVRTTPHGLFLYVGGTQVNIDRRTARMLARRIDQCLRATSGSKLSTASDEKLSTDGNDPSLPDGV